MKPGYDLEPWFERKDIVADTTRSPFAILKTLKVLNFENGQRYSPKGNKTFCNIAMWDGTKALGCEIPHYYNPETGHKTKFGVGKEMSANDIQGWMDSFGKENGWEKVSGTQAIIDAANGLPVLIVYTNPNYNKSGHVAFFLDGNYVIQAGAKCGIFSVIEIFGNLPFTLYTHKP